MFFMQFKTVYDLNDKIKRSRFDVFVLLRYFISLSSKKF